MGHCRKKLVLIVTLSLTFRCVADLFDQCVRYTGLFLPAACLVADRWQPSSDLACFQKLENMNAACTSCSAGNSTQQQTLLPPRGSGCLVSSWSKESWDLTWSKRLRAEAHLQGSGAEADRSLQCRGVFLPARLWPARRHLSQSWSRTAATRGDSSKDTAALKSKR